MDLRLLPPPLLLLQSSSVSRLIDVHTAMCCKLLSRFSNHKLMITKPVMMMSDGGTRIVNRGARRVAIFLALQLKSETTVSELKVKLDRGNCERMTSG